MKVHSQVLFRKINGKGETLPVIKSSLPNLEDIGRSTANITTTHGKHILFGGTNVIQIYPSENLKVQKKEHMNFLVE